MTNNGDENRIELLTVHEITRLLKEPVCRVYGHSFRLERAGILMQRTRMVQSRRLPLRRGGELFPIAGNGNWPEGRAGPASHFTEPQTSSF